MANVGARTLKARLAEWTRGFENGISATTRAVELYCGNSWSPVRKLYQKKLISPFVRIWIVSAGHGLLTPETELASYSATFTGGHPDSVIPKQLMQHGVDEWWEGLVSWRRKLGQKVSAISEIAQKYPTEPMVIALSSDYLTAVKWDILAARNALSDQDTLILISSGSDKGGALEGNFLPCDSRLENKLGRGRSALNVRILDNLLQTHPVEELSISRLTPRYKAILEHLPVAGYPKREASTDDEVRKFIKTELHRSKNASHSGLLRSYRSSGRACEQSRFRQLFQELK